MAELDDIEKVKDAFKKIQRLVTSQAEFRLWGKSYVKKERVDDIFCYIIALLPDEFKRMAKQRVSSTSLPSITAYNRLLKILKVPFFLNKNIYITREGEVVTYVKSIITNLERDIKRIESGEI